MKKKDARQVYQRMLTTYAGMDVESALERSMEEVVSGKELSSGSFLIKLRLDNHLHQGIVFEHITFKKKRIEYQSLVKKGNKYLLWNDSGVYTKEVSI